MIGNFCWADTIYVPGEYPTIQEGIDATVDGDTVLVADGTYTRDGNKNLDYNGKAITVKSENGADETIIDCEGDGRGFYFHSEEGLDSILEGFTIQNGSAEEGGGIYCNSSSPTITNCTIERNTASGFLGDGGGIFCKTTVFIIVGEALSQIIPP